MHSWAWGTNLVACPSQGDAISLKWELGEGGALRSWLHLPGMKFLSPWAGSREGRNESWFKCYRLSLFLLSFTRFSWINIFYSICYMPSWQFPEIWKIIFSSLLVLLEIAKFLMLSFQNRKSKYFIFKAAEIVGICNAA